MKFSVAFIIFSLTFITSCSSQMASRSVANTTGLEVDTDAVLTIATECLENDESFKSANVSFETKSTSHFLSLDQKEMALISATLVSDNYHGKVTVVAEIDSNEKPVILQMDYDVSNNSGVQRVGGKGGRFAQGSDCKRSH